MTLVVQTPHKNQIQIPTHQTTGDLICKLEELAHTFTGQLIDFQPTASMTLVGNMGVIPPETDPFCGRELLFLMHKHGLPFKNEIVEIFNLILSRMGVSDVVYAFHGSRKFEGMGINGSVLLASYVGIKLNADAQRKLEGQDGIGEIERVFTALLPSNNTRA